MIDPTVEECFLYSLCPKQLGLNRDTVESYINKGRPVVDAKGRKVMDDDGNVVMAYMDRIKLPGGWGTSRQAYNRFIAALNGMLPNGEVQDETSDAN